MDYVSEVSKLRHQNVDAKQRFVRQSNLVLLDGEPNEGEIELAVQFDIKKVLSCIAPNHLRSLVISLKAASQYEDYDAAFAELFSLFYLSRLSMPYGLIYIAANEAVFRCYCNCLQNALSQESTIKPDNIEP